MSPDVNPNHQGFESPLVSIITPSYNQAQFIEQNLQCIEKQTYDPIEHIVIDGGSDDGTVDLLKRYDERYNLYWQSGPDGGQADAINTGFVQSRGEIVGWINSDDLYFRKDTLETVVEVFETNPDVSIVYGDSIFIDSQNRPLKVRKRKYWRNGRFLRGWTIPQPSIFFRQEVISSQKLDDSLEFTLDLEFWIRIFDRFKSTYIDQIVGVDRLHKEAKRVATDPAIYKDELHDILSQHGQKFKWDYRILSKIDIIYLILMRLWGTIDALSTPDSNMVNIDMSWAQKRMLLSQFAPYQIKS